MLDPQSDLFAHLLMKFPRLLCTGARVGVIVANSWLGTDWGQQFRRELGKHFYVRAIITSANGRWFATAGGVLDFTIDGTMKNIVGIWS